MAETTIIGTDDVFKYIFAAIVATSAVAAPMEIFTFPVEKINTAPVATVATVNACWIIIVIFLELLNLPSVAIENAMIINNKIIGESRRLVQRLSLILRNVVFIFSSSFPKSYN